MIVNQYGTYKEHGHRHTRLYNIWSGLKARCNRKSNPDYKLYGARGIRATLQQWADTVGIKANTLLYRLRRGWSVERALTT